MVTLINYGLGNIQAFANIYHLNNIPYKIASSVDDLRIVDRLILPGVGSFDWAMEKLNNSGMRERIDELVLLEKKKVIGICVGMQMMAHGSDEGKLPGLGWINGLVKHLSTKSADKNIFLPHMGWNSVHPNTINPLFTGMKELEFYFLHSYYFQTTYPSNILGTTNYHVDFASAIYFENIFGVQFHPEKSHHWGKQLLINFATI
jgi:glutamine amidotransferase